MDRKELVTALPADMSKAFDSLCPALTIKKLKAYGFGNRSFDLGTGQKVWGGEVSRSGEGVGYEVLSLVQRVGRAIFSYP